MSGQRWRDPRRMTTLLRALAATGLMTLSLAAVPSGSAAEATAPDACPDFRWPGGAATAVSLSYDDALASQLDNALPALQVHGFKASFYLTLANPTVASRLADWRAAAAAGHELGNHTLFHPCSRTAAPGRDWVAPHRDLDRSTVAQVSEEILAANAFLQAIDGRSARTFTAPCADLLASGQPYLPVVRSAFIASKTRVGGITDDVTQQDPHEIGSADPTGLSGDALIALVSDAAARSRGRMLISITFHGIGGDYLVVSADAHRQLLAHLAAHPERYWIDSFAGIMSRVQARRCR